MNLEMATLEHITYRDYYNIYIKIILDKGGSFEYTNIENRQRVRVEDVKDHSTS